MDLYQVDIITEIDDVAVTVNAGSNNEAISIALTMFEQGEIDCEGTEVVNITAWPAF